MLLVVFGARAREACKQLYERRLQVGSCHWWWRLAVCWLSTAGGRQCSWSPLLPTHHSLQASNAAYERDADRLLTIATSFECREVQA